MGPQLILDIVTLKMTGSLLGLYTLGGRASVCSELSAQLIPIVQALTNQGLAK